MVGFKTNDGREIAVPFIELPTKRELPDYYEVVHNPMDFARIKKKIDKGRYSTIEEMGHDVKLLCENARVCWLIQHFQHFYTFNSFIHRSYEF
ncbi:unnamed protein product [Cylicostephanus goldi]|uniref:Bromo domain-containing protein n=1 Tax=Cylicostephanus goldi TaxID=71465 RepID=A0A3P7QII3_CYLGO|nr:unnamed protein product [Cylicostephanus goldi]